MERQAKTVIRTASAALEPFVPAHESLNPSSELKRRFGDFTIYVSSRPVDPAKRFEAQRDMTEPDVWWQESVDELDAAAPPVWTAFRAFGNVELRWSTTAQPHRLDTRWPDLERLVHQALDKATK
jgi:hypothetical protein